GPADVITMLPAGPPTPLLPRGKGRPCCVVVLILAPPVTVTLPASIETPPPTPVLPLPVPPEVDVEIEVLFDSVRAPGTLISTARPAPSGLPVVLAEIVVPLAVSVPPRITMLPLPPPTAPDGPDTSSRALVTCTSPPTSDSVFPFAMRNWL